MNREQNYSTFLRLFRGREDYFAQQGKDYYLPINRSIDEYYLERHFNGDITIGVYVLSKESFCYLLCIDLDIPKGQVNSIDTRNHLEKYNYLAPQLHSILDILYQRLNLPSNSVLLEDTGGRGYHLWLFLSQPILGTMAVAFGKALKEQLDFDFEFFPKQGRITPKRKFGNLIKLPLGLHRGFDDARSKFFTIDSDGPTIIHDIQSNLDHLNHLTPINSLDISAIAESYQGELLLRDELMEGFLKAERRPNYAGNPGTLISQCTAMGQLSKKAKSGEPFTHMEAFHFANTMLSVAGGINEIHGTMQSSYGPDYTPEKTNIEIERIVPLYPTSCKTLIKNQICSGYCKPSVQKINEDPLAPNTSPCSVWLTRERTAEVEPPPNLRELIGTKETVELAFFRLKRYYEDVITLFYDAFDFDLFARNINEYSQVIARSLDQQLDLPFAGYLPVLIPKKLNDTQELEYRSMSYSTVFDQVPIQSVFDVLGPIVDANFHKSSYGYRWNKDKRFPYRIFEDWKENFPRFRDDIKASLQENPNGYHICCDIKGYYDNVDQDILLEQLRIAINDEFIYRFVERLVRAYEYEGDSRKGLPQGPAYARLLANLFLNDFDAYVSGFSAGYFRYVDDFVIVFDSLIAAEKALEKIMEGLLSIGLQLSQDSDKRPTITPNTDFTKVRRILDMIQYGIFENTRHIRYVDSATINDFYDAVERNNVTPSNLAQAIEINEFLPTLLYVASQEILIPHPFRSKILAITDFLIRKGWFFPKRLGTVFNRLLEIEQEKLKFVSLFDRMEASHKVFFLLALFDKWRIERTDESVLVGILKKSIFDDDPFVRGFSIAIAIGAHLIDAVGVTLNAMLERISTSENWFDLVRFIGATDYLSLSLEERERVRDLVGHGKPEIVKIFLLENLTAFPHRYLDQLFLKRFIAQFSGLLLPAVASLIAAATDDSELLRASFNFLSMEPKVKSLAVSLITKQFSKRCSSANPAEIENLLALHERIEDPEFKIEITRILHRNSDAYREEIHKTHKLLERYNKCFFYEHIADSQIYSHMELIPGDLIREYTQYDVGMAKRVIEELSEKGIVPQLAFYYDSANEEIRIHFMSHRQYRALSKTDFRINDKDSVLAVLKLASNIFRKAIYFQRIMGKTPLVSVKNLLLDLEGEEAVFRTIGQSLKTPYIISGHFIGEKISDISLMVAILIRELLFENEDDYETFRKQENQSPLNAFVVQFIQNMSGKEHSLRYSSLRLQYLVERIIELRGFPESDLAVFYLRERLRSVLFQKNREIGTWQGVSVALKEHVSQIRIICTLNVLQRFKYKNYLFATSLGRQKLHRLSKQFLNFAFNRKNIEQSISVDPTYADLLEYLLLLSVIFIEMTSLCRTMYKDDEKKSREDLARSLSGTRINLQAAKYEIEVLMGEMGAILNYSPYETGNDLRDLSLSQMALSVLISCGVSLVDGNLKVSKPRGVSETEFDDLVHVCLFRIPRIENDLLKCIEHLSLALRDNEDPALSIEFQKIYNDIEIIAKVLNKFRRRQRMKRYFGYSDGTKFPEHITCIAPLRRKMVAGMGSLPGISLTNSFPSSRFECSWDVHGERVTNLVVPNLGIYQLSKNVTKGRIFGVKFSYLYTGKSMLIWDALAFVISFLFLTFLKYEEGVITKSFILALISVSTSIITIFNRVIFAKLFYDLAKWIPFLDSIIKNARISIERKA